MHAVLFIILILLVIALVIVVARLLSYEEPERMHLVQIRTLKVEDCNEKSTFDAEPKADPMNELASDPNHNLVASLSDDAQSAHNQWASKYKDSGLNIINRHQIKENPLYSMFKYNANGRAPRVKNNSEYQVVADVSDEEIAEFNENIKNKGFTN